MWIMRIVLQICCCQSHLYVRGLIRQVWPEQENLHNWTASNGAIFFYLPIFPADNECKNKKCENISECCIKRPHSLYSA